MTGADSDTRRRRQKAGQRGETWAAVWLALKGYRPIARRLKTPVGEIDLVLRRGRLLVFAEVKSHRRGDPEAVSATQRRRIGRAAAWLLANRPSLEGLDCRFDVVMMRGLAPPRHILDAWRPEL